MQQSNVKQRFGLAVKKWRTRSGLSQEELAWRAGLHRSYVADIERGARNASLQSIEKLAGALEVSMSALFEPLHEATAATANPATSSTDTLVEILLVEDDAVDADMAIRAFRKAGVRNPIRVVNDGSAALEYLFGSKPGEGLLHRPKLILLDLHLPKVSGMQVLRTIKRDERTRDIPVIILTGSGNGRVFLEAKKLGADVYIEKPVDFLRFCEVAPQLSLYWALFSEPAGESREEKTSHETPR